MPTNTVKTPNCQYVLKNGKDCGKPPNFLHVKSGRAMCWNHHARLAIVTSGWVNLQRVDAQAEIDRLKARLVNTPVILKPCMI